jgi:hypothetical protein
MAAPVLQFKRGLFSNLPGLRAGEPGFTTDKYDLYVGIDSTSANNQFVGSGRFWTVETSSTGSGVNLVEGTSNGTNYITLASPASLAGIVTYYLPGTQGNASSVLTNDGSGNLSWGAGSANSVLTGITTVQGQLNIEASTDISGITTVTNTTDNTLGDADTGAFQIDGGLGVNKNVTVGGNLNVQGYSEFVGVVTFKGGTINLGDADTDDINVGGEFISGLVPDATKTHDLGELAKQWRDIYAGGSLYGTESIVGTASSTRVDYAVTVASKTADHRYFGSGSSSGYFIDGVEAPFITLLPGKTYRFDQSDASNATHPLAFYLESSRTTSYTTNVTTNGTAGSAGAYTEITLTDTTPQVLHYQCTAHPLMGNAVATQSNVVHNNFQATFLEGIAVTGVSTFTGQIDGNGGADISGGETTLSSATVSDLTSGRVVLAGTSGALEDSGNLTFDGSTLTVTGDASVTDSISITNDGSVGGALTVTGAIDGNGGADISGGETTLSSATVSDLTSGRVVLAGTSGALEDSGNLTFNGSLLTVTGDVTVTDSIAVTKDAVVSAGLTVTGAVDFNGGLDVSGAETTLSSATVSDLTSGRVVLAGTSGALEDSGNLTFNGTTLNVTGNATVDNVRIDGNEIDTTSGGLTLDSASGTVTVDDDLTINGNFTVLGTQSIINTETLKVEDSLIEVGLVNSGGSLVPPSSDANIDVGVVLHYYSGSAKTAAMFWDDSAGRIVVASEVTESTSVMGSITYANLEIGALTVTDCQGISQSVITCSGSTRTLENITIDGGSF